MRRLLQHLPVQFRVLYRQFLLRVVDLESLSIQADIPRFLGQFAGVLILISSVAAMSILMFPPPRALSWHMEQSSIANMMFVIGLISVLTWDSTFPDRRDSMVLGPLPVKPRTVLLAKVAASGTLLGLAILCLNFASGTAQSLVFATPQSASAILRFAAVYWFIMIASSVFIYGSVLTIQGLTAFLLSRRLFLRFSAIAQLAAFGLLFSVYFLAPYVKAPSDLAALRDHPLLAASPVSWFFALFNQCNGSLPAEGRWLADRAWIGLACAVIGAVASLLICYLRTMRKTAEEPDLVPAGRGMRWNLQPGSGFQSAVFFFILRTLKRSRQHRVILAFFYAIVIACALGLAHRAPSIGSTSKLPYLFILMTFWMMVFAIMGFRAIAPLPISLAGNWVWQITQLRPPKDYMTAVWNSIVVLAVLPVWIAAAILSLSYRPFWETGAHLVVLLLFGLILVDLSLVGFHKIPFTCSYLPGKTNFQFVFWTCCGVGLLIGLFAMDIEFPALHNRTESALLIIPFAAAFAGLRILNRQRARSTALYFEESFPEVITRIGLLSSIPPKSRTE